MKRRCVDSIYSATMRLLSKNSQLKAGTRSEAIIITHTCGLVRPSKERDESNDFLVQAIKKLFVTCQAAYDREALGRGAKSTVGP